MKENENSFKDRFKILLDDRGMSCTEAGRKLNISRQVVDNCIKGSDIRISTFKEIIKAFPEIDVYWLLFGKSKIEIIDSGKVEKSKDEVFEMINDLKKDMTYLKIKMAQIEKSTTSQ